MILAASVLAVASGGAACAHSQAGQLAAADESLTEDQLDRLEALASVYRHARWFHPSDEVARAPWDALLILMTRAILAAPDDVAAAEVLRAHFDPLLRGEDWSADPFPVLSDDEVRQRLDDPDAVRWLHIGVGENQYGYFGQRVEAGAIDSSDLVTLDLLPSLHLRLPLVLPGEAETPHESNPDWRIPRSIPYEDQASRLAGVIELWATVETGFPYHDLNEADWSDALRPALADAATAAPGREMIDVLKRMMTPLEDGHVDVLYGAMPHQVPILLERLDGRIVVTGRDPALDTIAPGDVLVSIDGEPAGERLTEEMALVSGSAQWKEAVGLGAILHTKRGTTLDLGFDDGKIIRAFAVSQSDPRVVVEEDFRPGPLTDLGDGILYFDISRIDEDAMPGAIDRMKDARAVLFDMRGYPRDGTDFLAALAVRRLRSADFQTGRISHPDWRTINYEGQGWLIEPSEDAMDIPVAMLIDGRAYSYAESIAGLFKGEALGPLIGTPTAGANGNITYIALPDDYFVYWTGMRVTNRDGSRHHARGVVPDILVRPTIEGVRAGRDEVLEAGLAVLREQLASVPGVAGDTLLDDAALEIDPFVEAAPEHEPWIPSVREHHRPIRSLVSEEYGDLGFLRDVLAGKSLVHIGESGHGMAEFNHLKVRLVKYLHRELGFDVLAIESPLWGCWDADRRADDLSAEEFMRACAVPVWQTREILEIFRYAKETRAAGERPLHIVGFDSQAAPRLDRAIWLSEALEPIDPDLARNVRTADSAFLAAYRVGRGTAHVDSSGAELIDTYEAAETAVVAAPGLVRGDPDVLGMVLRSARAHVRQLADRAAGRGSSETRDVAMAENIAFLVRAMHPDARIVTWGHNYHLRHENASVRRVETGEHLPATTGSLLHDDFAAETYTIGMYTGSGRAGLVTRRVFDVAEPSPRHGETLLMQAGRRYLFVDLSPDESNEDRWMTSELPFMWEGSLDIAFIPADQYDGLIYVHETGPPTY